jgi:protein-S-isoprenylcysteine O-methyltransferase Ste14
MKFRRTPRIIIGFAAALLFIWRAHPSPSSYVIGMVLMAAGECIRFVSAGTLIKFEGVTRAGVYAFTRNPLYIGSFVIGLGACVMGRDPVFAVLFLVLFPLVYASVIRREERYLIGRYGDDYVAYLREVPRLFPRKFDLAGVLRESSPFLAVKNRELHAILGLLAVLAFMAVKMTVVK